MTTKKASSFTDEELNEQCALAQGMVKCDPFLPNRFIEKYKDHEYRTVNGEDTFLKSGYHPTANTEAGRSQCFELMVKFGISLAKVEGGLWWIIGFRNLNYSKNPQRLICEAVVMSVKGEEV